MPFNYTAHNAAVWNKLSSEGYVWTVPIGHDEFVRAQHGDWRVVLTPLVPVPRDWFLPFRGARLLGLASAGGQQMPIFAALGASVTVFDLSENQLASERLVAEREGYDITIVQGDMTQPFPFADGSFDMIFHPVSNCFVRDVEHLWRECYRVLRPGGVVMAGFCNPYNYLFEDSLSPEGDVRVTGRLPVDPVADCSTDELVALAQHGAIEFSHSLETQIGGQLKAGLCLTHLYEDFDPRGPLGNRAPAFIATRAVKP
ncbi:MAG: class I SAM-dependent methyltransferase [Chloroflexi bacterium]|nr:class I SAM-dependent methyltransferase [Chloroflexota bacterium]